MSEYQALKAAWIAMRAEQASERWRASQADDDDLGPMSDGDPVRPIVRRGRDRSKTGRVGSDPTYPVDRQFDEGIEPPTDSRGEPIPIPEKPTPPRIVASSAVREKLARGAATAILLDAEPAWKDGEVVPVMRRGSGDERDAPLLLEVQSLEWFEAREIDAHKAKMLGFPSLGAFAQDRYPHVKGNAQFKVRHLGLDESAVWFAVVVPSMALAVTVIELDDEEGRAAPGVLDPHWLSTSGKRSYETSSNASALTDAGVCIEPWRQERYSEGGRKKTAAAAKEGSRKARVRRRDDDETRQSGAAYRAEPRRKLRKATLDRPSYAERRREEATPEEIAAFVGKLALPDGESLRLEPHQQAIADRFERDADGNWVAHLQVTPEEQEMARRAVERRFAEGVILSYEEAREKFGLPPLTAPEPATTGLTPDLLIVDEPWGTSPSQDEVREQLAAERLWLGTWPDENTDGREAA